MEATFLIYLFFKILGVFCLFVLLLFLKHFLFAKQLKGELGQHVFQQKIASFANLENWKQKNKENNNFWLE